MSKNHRHYVHLCTLVFQNVKVTSMQHQSISQQQLEHVKFKALDGELRCQLTNYKTMSSTYVQLLVTYPFEF